MAGGSSDEPPKLIKSTVTDTGRHFFDAPTQMSMDDCVIRLIAMDGIDIASLVPAEIGQWLVFQLDGYSFTASDPLREVWFYADDPETPEAILQKIALHIVTPSNAS
ncbi:MAG: hypothetical protein V7651_18325 [Hyphomonas oceanitis]|uniref:hypothetical protein n=1 Tax=Hyphomonas oceanitis TaxID=81033 RepID=UPI0030020DE2